MWGWGVKQQWWDNSKSVKIWYFNRKNNISGFNLTTPWPKARKNLNFRNKFKDFSWPSAKGWSFFFVVSVFSPQYDHLEGAHSLWHFLGQISSYFLKPLSEMGSIHWLDCIPEYRDYSPAKIGSFRINKQPPNFLFLSAVNRKAWAHIMPCDAFLFLRDLENPVRRCSLICMQKHRFLPKKLSGAIHN